MADTPTYEYFNTSVKGWANGIKRGLVVNARSLPQHNAKDSPKRKAPKLVRSISVGYKKSHGVISQIRFSFAQQGLFIHLGVGRGWVWNENTQTAMRGRKYGGDEIGLLKNRGYSRKEISKMRYYYKDEEKTESIRKKRETINWFDVEIRKGMKWLAEYTGDFYGEKAMDAIVKQMEKPLPLSTKYVKVRPKKQ